MYTHTCRGGSLISTPSEWLHAPRSRSFYVMERGNGDVPPTSLFGAICTLGVDVVDAAAATLQTPVPDTFLTVKSQSRR